MKRIISPPGVGDLSDPSILFASLVGLWKLKRIIHPQGLFEGTARFDWKTPSTLAYKEEGLLCIPGSLEGPATKEYLYRLENNQICVYFPEQPPRLFHRLERRPEKADTALSAEASHICSADEYLSEYIFRHDGTFRIQHRVRGPRKNYVLDSEYERREE